MQHFGCDGMMNNIWLLFVLAQTGYHVSGVFHDDFLLVMLMEGSKVYQVDLLYNINQHREVETYAKKIGDVLFNHEDKYIAWTDMDPDNPHIGGIFVNTTRFVVAQIPENYVPKYITYEHSSNLLFYSAYDGLDPTAPDIIAVVNERGVHQTIINTGIQKDFLVLDSVKGYIFFLNYKHSPFRGVYRMTTTGLGLTRIIDWGNITGIYLDRPAEAILLSDLTTKNIFSCGYDGQNCVVNFSLSIDDFHHIQIVKGHFYLSTRGLFNRHVVESPFSADVWYKTFLGDLSREIPAWSLDAQLSGETDQDPKHPICSVNNGGCADFCLPTPSNYSCGAARCPKVIQSENATITETRSCKRLGGNTCSYTCDYNFLPKFSSINCTWQTLPGDTNELLWDIEQLEKPLCVEQPCPERTIANGQFDAQCSGYRGDNCINFTCNLPYERDTDILSLRCMIDFTWEHPLEKICIGKCPLLENGIDLNSECTRLGNTTCSYACPAGKSANHDQIWCGTNYQWNVTSDQLCEDIDECALDPCDTGVPCQNTDGSFRCGCSPGYIFNGVNCAAECLKLEDGAVLHSTCNRKPSEICSYSCPTGYTVMYDQITCKEDLSWSVAADQLCYECLSSPGTLQLSFSQVVPLLPSGLINVSCGQCHNYENVKYEWMLSETASYSTPYRDCLNYEKVFISPETGNTIELSCSSIDCGNLLNGTSERKLTLVFTVIAQDKMANDEEVVSSVHSDVFLRQLPISEDELKCSFDPKVGGQAIKTEYQLNCTSLHERYELLGHTADFYASNPRKFRKEIVIESDREVILIDDFPEPVSRAFVLPAGNITVNVTVIQNKDVIMQQTFQLQVQEVDIMAIGMAEFENWIQYVANSFSLVYSIACGIRETLSTIETNQKLDDMRFQALTKLNELNFSSSLQQIHSRNTVFEILTENYQWIDNTSKKINLAVEHNHRTSLALGDLKEEPIEVLSDIAGNLAERASILLNQLIDDHDQTNSSVSYSIEKSTMAQVLMESLDKTLEALQKLDMTEVPFVLYNDSSFTCLIHKTKGWLLLGTKLVVKSGDLIQGGGVFQFPDTLNVDAPRNYEIQMIYQKKNPYVWHNPSIKVTEPVITVTLKDDNNQEMLLDKLGEPVKYQTRRISNVTSTSHINITYTRIGDTFTAQAGSQMLLINFTMEKGETKLLDITLPETISDVWIFGQPFSPPDYYTVVNTGVKYPSRGRELRAMYGFDDPLDSDSVLDEKSVHELYITANDEYFAVNQSHYYMYFGIALNFGDDLVRSELRGMDATCDNFDNSTTEECNGSMQIPFVIQMDGLSCVYWNDEAADWSTNGCEAHPGTEGKHLECWCYHLTSFSAKFRAGEFQTSAISVTFELYIPTFYANPVLVAAVGVVWMIYFSLMYWAYGLDKQDLKPILVVPCEENSPTETYLYLVCVQTAWLPWAGTSANVYMRITGKNGSSPKKKISTDDKLRFQTGREDWFLFSTEESLGSLKSLSICHDDTGPNPHWYLSQVLIKDIQTEKKWTFIFDDWLAVARGHIKHTATSMQAITEGDMKTKCKHNLITSISQYMRMSHLWISVWSGRPLSCFTRVQRLTCLLSLVLTIMLTNMMLHGLPSDYPISQLHESGFSFSFRQFYLGIASSGIVFPINLIISQLFIQTKQKTPKESRSYKLYPITEKVEDEEEKETVSESSTETIGKFDKSSGELLDSIESMLIIDLTLFAKELKGSDKCVYPRQSQKNLPKGKKRSGKLIYPGFFDGSSKSGRSREMRYKEDSFKFTGKGDQNLVDEDVAKYIKSLSQRIIYLGLNGSIGTGSPRTTDSSSEHTTSPDVPGAGVPYHSSKTHGAPNRSPLSNAVRNRAALPDIVPNVVPNRSPLLDVGPDNSTLPVSMPNHSSSSSASSKFSMCIDSLYPSSSSSYGSAIQSSPFYHSSNSSIPQEGFQTKLSSNDRLPIQSLPNKDLPNGSSESKDGLESHSSLHGGLPNSSQPQNNYQDRPSPHDRLKIYSSPCKSLPDSSSSSEEEPVRRWVPHGSHSESRGRQQNHMTPSIDLPNCSTKYSKVPNGFSSADGLPSGSLSNRSSLNDGLSYSFSQHEALQKCSSTSIQNSSSVYGSIQTVSSTYQSIPNYSTSSESDGLPYRKNWSPKDDLSNSFSSNDDLPKNLSPKDGVSKSLSPKNDLPKSLSPKDDLPKSLSPKDDLPKSCSPKDDLPKNFSPKDDLPKSLTPKNDLQKSLSPKNDLPKSLSPKDDLPKSLSPKDDLPKSLSPKNDLPKSLSPKDDLPKSLSPKDDLPKSLSPKNDLPKSLSPKDDLPKSLSPNDDLPKSFSPKDDLPKSSSQQEQNCSSPPLDFSLSVTYDLDGSSSSSSTVEIDLDEEGRNLNNSAASRDIISWNFNTSADIRSTPSSISSVSSTTITSERCSSSYSLETTGGVKISSLYVHSNSGKEAMGKVFPCWFIYVAWAVVIASCVGSSVVVVLYGLRYGYTRGAECSVSVVTGWVFNLIVEQPLKVVCIAAVPALILRKPFNLEESGPVIEKKLDNSCALGEQCSNNANYNSQRCINPTHEPLIEKTWLTHKLVWIRKALLQEWVLYILYLTVLLLVVHGHNNRQMSYRNSQTVYNMFVTPNKGPSLLNVTCPEEFYTYMLETFSPQAGRLSVSNKEEAAIKDSHYMLGLYRIRQVRVKPGDCRQLIPNNLAKRCVTEYKRGSEDTESYGELWFNQTDGPSIGLWAYYTPEDLHTLSYSGIHETYSGGGYVILLKGNVTDRISELKERGWLDGRTRAVFVECTIYNPDIDMFTLVILLLEITPIGKMYPTYEISSRTLYHHSSRFRAIIAFCEVLFLCFNISFVNIECKKLNRLSKNEYFSDIWNYVELLQIILSSIAVGLFIKQSLTISSALKEISESFDKRYINFGDTFYWNFVFECVLAILVTIVMAKSIKLLKFYSKTKLLVVTVQKCGPDLTCFLVMFIIIIMAYVLYSVLVFGRELGMYRNVHHSLYTNVGMLLSSNKGVEMKAVSNLLGPIYLISFLMVVSFVFMKLCVAIVITARIIAKSEMAGEDRYKINDHISKVGKIATWK